MIEKNIFEKPSKNIKCFCPNGAKVKDHEGRNTYENVCKSHSGYIIPIEMLNDGMVQCWSCGTYYLQKAHTENTEYWIRQLIHTTKGEK
jgi:hypothetical protein